MTAPVNETPHVVLDFSASMESMRAAMVNVAEAFRAIGRGLALAIMGETARRRYLAALARLDRAERIRRSQVRPLAIDGHAYRRRTRRRKP